MSTHTAVELYSVTVLYTEILAAPLDTGANLPHLDELDRRLSAAQSLAKSLRSRIRLVASRQSLHE